MDFQCLKHIAFFRRFLRGVLPPSSVEADQVRVVVLYFALHSLDICGGLDLSEAQRDELVDWILGWQFDRKGGPAADFNIACVYASLASLQILGRGLDRVPADDVVACIRRLQFLEADSASSVMHGALCARLPLPAEADVRFVFAASAICSLLGRWDAMDIPAAVSFVCACQSYEGGFGLCPGQEAHGGSTYCALAALDLLGCPPRPPTWPIQGTVESPSHSQPPSQPPFPQAHSALDPSIAKLCRQQVADKIDSAALARWLSLRTVSLAAESYLSDAAKTEEADASADTLVDSDPRYRGGLSGRAGKPADACYAWWCGAARLILQQSVTVDPGLGQASPWPEPWTDRAALASFLLKCQYFAGGCGKDWEALPDPLHSCYGIVGR